MHRIDSLPPARRTVSRRILAGWLAALCLAVYPAEAITFLRESDYHVPEEVTVEQEIWVRAFQVRVDGEMGNQLYAVATNVVLNGIFRDDVWAASSGSLRFDGTADNHVRLAAAAAVQCGGQIADNAMLAASTVKLEPGASLGANALLAGEDVITEASIAGDLRVYASKATLGGTLGGSVRIFAEDLVMLPGTVIEGDLVYTMSKELVLSKQVELKGELIRRGFEDLFPAPGPRPASERLLLQAFFWVNAFLAGMFYVLFQPRLAAHAAARIRFSPGRCMLVGSLAFLLIPMGIQMLILNRVTLLLAGVMGLLYIAGIYLAKTIPALLIGGLLLRLKGPQPLPRILLSLLAGFTLLYTLMAIPLLGAFLWVAATCLGLGSVMLASWDTQMRALSGPPRSPAIPPPLADSDNNVHTGS